MKLNRKERAFIGMMLDNHFGKGTIKEHIEIEDIFKKIKLDTIDYPALDNNELFNKYQGMRVEDIEDENDRNKLKELLAKFNFEVITFWSKPENDVEEEFNINDEEIKFLKKMSKSETASYPIYTHKTIISLMKKNISGKISSEMAIYYDSIEILFEAIKLAKSTNSTKIKKTLFSIKNYQGVTGPITFDKNGDANKQIIILKLVKNGVKYITSISPNKQ